MCPDSIPSKSRLSGSSKCPSALPGSAQKGASHACVNLSVGCGSTGQHLCSTSRRLLLYPLLTEAWRILQKPNTEAHACMLSPDFSQASNPSWNSWDVEFQAEVGKGHPSAQHVPNTLSLGPPRLLCLDPKHVQLSLVLHQAPQVFCGAQAGSPLGSKVWCRVFPKTARAPSGVVHGYPSASLGSPRCCVKLWEALQAASPGV